MVWHIEMAGDAAILVSFTSASLTQSNRQVRALVQALRHAPPTWRVDYIPAYHTLLVCFDLNEVDHFEVKAVLQTRLEASQWDVNLLSGVSHQRTWLLPC